MSNPVGTRATFSCDACGTSLVKRTSRLQHRHLRTDVWVCQNPLCGASYAGHSELISIASPSGIPEAPACELPPTPAYERAILQMQWRMEHGSKQMDLLDAIAIVESAREATSVEDTPQPQQAACP